MTGPWGDDAPATGETEPVARPEPHHLHPLTLLLNFLSILPQYIVVIPAVGIAMSEGGSGAILLLILIGAAIAMLIAWIKWRRFSYEVGKEEIRIQQGVFSRQNRSIPYERIQDVSVEQKLIARMFGLAAVKFETGSGGGEDGVLNAVDLEEAARLRDIVRRRKGALAATATHDAGPETGEGKSRPLFAMDARRIFIAGIFNFSLVFLAILGVLFQNIDFLIPETYLDPAYWLRESGIDDQLVQAGMATRLWGAVVALFGLVLIGLVTGIVRTFIREYGFRLDRTENGFRRRRGLFTLTDVVMPLHRVQAAVIVTGPIRRRFGWRQLKFQSLASDGKNETDHSVAPLASLDEIDRVLAEAKIRRDVEWCDMHAVHPAYWWMPLCVIVPLATIGIVAGSVFGDAQFLWLLPALYVLAAGAGGLRWWCHRYVLKEDQLFVTAGFWRQRMTILPLARVQSVDISDSYISRALGLADITVGVAGGSGIAPLAVHAIPQAAALGLRRQLLQIAA